MGFSRQEYWSRLPCPTPEDLPDPGIEPTSPVSPTSAGRFLTTEPRGKPWTLNRYEKNVFSLCNSIHYLVTSVGTTSSHLLLLSPQCCQAEWSRTVLRGKAIQPHHSKKEDASLPTITALQLCFLMKCKAYLSASHLVACSVLSNFLQPHGL